MHRIGEGGPRDEVEARRLFSLTAEQGHAEAQFSLGAIYYTGEGVTRDEVKARRLFSLAAEQGRRMFTCPAMGMASASQCGSSPSTGGRPILLTIPPKICRNVSATVLGTERATTTRIKFKKKRSHAG